MTLHGSLQVLLPDVEASGTVALELRLCVFVGRLQPTGLDVAQLLADANPPYDAILMDTDNGPDGLNREANDSLYSVSGLATMRKAVKHGGVLAVWSAGPDQPFAGRMRRAGFAVEEVQVRASPSGKGARHIIWVGVAR